MKNQSDARSSIVFLLPRYVHLDGNLHCAEGGEKNVTRVCNTDCKEGSRYRSRLRNAGNRAAIARNVTTCIRTLESSAMLSTKRRADSLAREKEEIARYVYR